MEDRVIFEAKRLKKKNRSRQQSAASTRYSAGQLSRSKQASQQSGIHHLQPIAIERSSQQDDASSRVPSASRQFTYSQNQRRFQRNGAREDHNRGSRLVALNLSSGQFEPSISKSLQRRPMTGKNSRIPSRYYQTGHGGPISSKGAARGGQTAGGGCMIDKRFGQQSRERNQVGSVSKVTFFDQLTEQLHHNHLKDHHDTTTNKTNLNLAILSPNSTETQNNLGGFLGDQFSPTTSQNEQNNTQIQLTEEIEPTPTAYTTQQQNNQTNHINPSDSYLNMLQQSSSAATAAQDIT